MVRVERTLSVAPTADQLAFLCVRLEDRRLPLHLNPALVPIYTDSLQRVVCELNQWALAMNLETLKLPASIGTVAEYRYAFARAQRKLQELGRVQVQRSV